MNLKTIGIILGLILFLGIVGAAVYKIIQKTEGYKTMGNSYYKTYDYHPTSLFGGCMRIPTTEESTPEKK